ncbi:MAG: HigA family addiction module antidote protein [Deltaproteobacteria bacterium]|nr:HigA family addiction module antidote protein [Deltaproteobacteria bacterium]
MIQSFKTTGTEDIFEGSASRAARKCCPQSIWPVARRLPRKRPPTHPGEMLFEEFVKPLELTQAELARRLGVSYPRLNEIIKGRRSVTPDTALRLSRVLGMSANFWLGLQQDWDLWHAMNSPKAKGISRLKPIPRAGKNVA